MPLSAAVLGLVCPAAVASQAVADRPVVESVEFRGNEVLDDGTLQASIRTTPPTFLADLFLTGWLGFGSKSRMNHREFRRDVLRIKAAYGVRGFPDAAVDTLVRRGDNAVDITFVIDEGAPVLVSSIDFSGTRPVFPGDRIREAIPLRIGEPFDRLAFQATTGVIQRMYRDRAYPFVTVSGSFRLDSATRTADVLYAVETGPQATVDSIVVVGSESIDRRVVLQSIPLRVGQDFSDEAIYNSQLALYRTDLFRYVEVSLVDSVPATPDSLVPVRVRIDIVEGPLRRARIGAGYGTMDCFRTLGTLTLLNFSGGGRVLRLEGATSQLGTGSPLGAGFERSVCPGLANEDTSRLKLNYRVTASMTDPLLLSRRTSGTVSIFGERRTEFQAFLSQAIGTNVSVTHALNDDVRSTVTYALSRGHVEANPATFCTFLNVCRVEDTRAFTENRFRSAISLGLVRNTANSLFDPTEGNALTAELGWASSLIGSDSLIQYTRGEFGFASYHSLGERTTLAWRVRAGFIRAPLLNLSAGDDHFIPPEERFYLGGSTTVRGFAQNELGPLVRVQDSVAEDGEPAEIRPSAVGGDRMFLANVELRFPFPIFSGRLAGAIFVDAGQLTNSGDRGSDNWRVTPGFGVRVGSPIGPIRLDVGYNPYPPFEAPLYTLQNGQLVIEPGRESYAPPVESFLDRIRVHFSIGQAF